MPEKRKKYDPEFREGLSDERWVGTGSTRRVKAW